MKNFCSPTRKNLPSTVTRSVPRLEGAGIDTAAAVCGIIEMVSATPLPQFNRPSDSNREFNDRIRLLPTHPIQLKGIKTVTWRQCGETAEFAQEFTCFARWALVS